MESSNDITIKQEEPEQNFIGGITIKQEDPEQIFIGGITIKQEEPEQIFIGEITIKQEEPAQNFIGGITIKQEKPDEDTISPTIVAAKIFYVDEKEKLKEEPRNPNAYVCHNDFKDQENGYNLSEDWLKVKEEDGELNEFVDAISDRVIQSENQDTCSENVTPAPYTSNPYICEAIEDLNIKREEELDIDCSDNEFVDFEQNSASDKRDTYGISATAAVENTVERFDPQSNTILLCLFCGVEFLSIFDWRRHLNDIHDFNKLDSLNMEFLSSSKAKCNQCKAELSLTLVSLQTHKSLHLPYKLYAKCKVCGELFKSIRFHRQHLETTHNVAYAEESRDYSKEAILICPFCGKKYPNYSDWRQHLNSSHEFNKIESLNMEYTSDKAKCKQCKMETKPNLASLQKHKIRHLPFKQFVLCKSCGKRFRNGRSHHQHFILVHNAFPSRSNSDYSNFHCQTNVILLCPFCGKELPNGTDWRKHINAVHEFNNRDTLNIEYVSDDQANCRQCTWRINHKPNNKIQCFQQHRITHLPYKLYFKCKLCGRCAGSSTLHKKHMERSHKLKTEDSH